MTPFSFQILYQHGMNYADAMTMQESAVARLRQHPDGPGLLLCVEHTPVVTLGRGSHSENVLCDPEILRARGVEIAAASRGGDVTWHGPGQITLYPVFPLDWFGRDLHLHMRRLEAVGVAYLAGHGIDAGREASAQPRTGVWVGDAKIAAIGIAVRGWVVYHGIGMNVQPVFEDGFDMIRPCGIADKGVTSLSRLTKKTYDMDAEMRRMVGAFFEVFDGASPASGPQASSNGGL